MYKDTLQRISCFSSTAIKLLQDMTKGSIQKPTWRTKKSSTQFLSRVCFHEQHKTIDKIRSPSTGLQDIGYHHYPSTVHKKYWQKIHYWMKVFMYLCNTQGNYLKWSLRLSESMEYLHEEGKGGGYKRGNDRNSNLVKLRWWVHCIPVMSPFSVASFAAHIWLLQPLACTRKLFSPFW